MATLLPASSLSRAAFPFTHSHAPTPKLPVFCTRAAADENNSDPPTPTKTEDETEAEFESRLSQVRLRYRSGTGKKAEIRKSKKAAVSSSSKSGAGIYLPPVPLKEPVSDGVKVEFGFSPYSEKLNGRIAMLGLSALLLVELATGKSVIKYHSPSIVLIQVYFIAAVTAVYVKFEKEKVSVWPQSAPATTE